MIHSVSSNAELAQAFALASAGDRIELAAGEYGAHALKGRDFDTAITITSADATNPAVFRGALTLQDVNGVELIGLDFAPDHTALDILDLVLVHRSQNVSVHGNTFTGHIPTASEGLAASEEIDTREKAKGLIEGQAFARGIRATDSDDISIQDNAFSQLRKGIILDTVQRVEVGGNHLHDLRSDGINLVDAVSVTIAENLMESFHPLHNYDNIAFADHGDFIQWWAGDGGLGIRDLTIRDNALLQGSGSWVQGIFGRSGGANADGSPAEFDGIRIENNLINTSHTNGIFIGDARNVDIIGNTLLPAPQDLTQPVITSGIPSIHIRTSAARLDEETYDFSNEGALPRDVRIQENTVVGEQAFTSYLIDPALYAALNITESGNAVLPTESDAASYWGNLFPALVSAPLHDPAQISQPASGVGFDPTTISARLQDLLDDPSRQTSSVQYGTADSDVLQADGSGRVLDAQAGDDTVSGTGQYDVLRGGLGSDRMLTGEGADRVAFHRLDLQSGDLDVITDLDFEAGDHLVFSGGFGSGYFDDDADETNALTTFRSGDSAIIHDRADLLELIAQDSVSAHSAGAEAVELRFDLNADQQADWTLRLDGIWDIGEHHGVLDHDGLSLTGTIARDTLDGGDGDDRIDGGGGSDILTGGGGADMFVVSWSEMSLGSHLSLPDINFAEGDRIQLQDWPPVHASEDASVSGASILTITSLAEFQALADRPDLELLNSTDQSTMFGFDMDGDGAIDALLTLGRSAEAPVMSNSAGLTAGTRNADILRGNSTEVQQIFGGEGDDYLIAGTLADRLFGGTGDDRFYVNNSGNIAAESANEGYDRVYASVDYTLGVNIEAVSASGLDGLRLTGNAQNNWISGNQANNVLSGKDGVDRLLGFDGKDWLDGGRGADILQGGIGSDRYVVDHTHDLVIENANEGYDLVYTTVDFHLGAEIEALGARGADNVNLTGNQSDNWLTGNSGDNWLKGLDGHDRLIGLDGDDVLTGGAGRDVLQGGNGRDVFTFSRDDGVDVITDFEAGSDLLLLDVLSETGALNAVETSTGVLIHHGAPGDMIMIQGMTQTALQTHAIFANDGDWVLEF